MKTKPRVFLDTNVLHPLHLRDLIFWFAAEDVLEIKWSAEVLAEWRQLLFRKGLSNAETKRRIYLANMAFPKALIKNNKEFNLNIQLPDPNDEHVLISAIVAQSDYILTLNKKDFPNSLLQQFNIVALTPDELLPVLIKNNPKRCSEAFRQLVELKKSPPLSYDDMRSIYLKYGLTETVRMMNKYDF